jgi:conjugal transfer pilus assembly protein TraW
MLRRHSFFSVVATLIIPCTASALELGVIGPVYSIEEPHLLHFIHNGLQERERRGEFRKLEEQARARGIEAVRNPSPVAGAHAGNTARTFYYDPTFALDRNILDERGSLLFPAGTRKNPLEIVSLSKHLLFFDGRDKRQVIHARELMRFYGGRVKPILVGGSYLDLMKAWQTPVYYDQQGVLTRRLGIKQVPAMVTQEGLRLRIDELALQ